MCLGLLLTWGAIGSLFRLIPPVLLDHMPYLQGLHFNLSIIVFALMIAVAGGTLFSAAPAFQLFQLDMQAGLMEGGRSAVSRSWHKIGSTLVAVELAISVVLLVSAGLLAKSFYRLLHEDIGIVADHLAMLHIVDPKIEPVAHEGRLKSK